MKEDVTRQFGRMRSEDARDASYSMQGVLRAQKSLRRWRFWEDRYWQGDQLQTPACVGYAWTHWLEAAPVRHGNKVLPVVNPLQLYQSAQKVDEWPGEEYEGTSVRAGAKVLQRMGFIESYHWAKSVTDIVQAILQVGPVVVGTDWYEGMSSPFRTTHRMRLTGAVQGGHAYLLTGVNRRRKELRVRNSWGRSWGNCGRAFISFISMKRLLQRGGEACLAVEISRGDPR